MFETLFMNPAALTVGGALISSPILIHLINRVRFKRVRWAAMEFLLKSQKRNRRRLIIEQLLLLLLRCLLVALAGLLLARFTGCEAFEAQTNLHFIVLDDSLSMLDKVGDKDDCFRAAKREILGTIAKSAAQSQNDGIYILRPSELARDPGFEPKFWDRLGETSRANDLESELAKMECTKQSLTLTACLKKCKDLAETAPAKAKITVHVLSDFRKGDWTGPQTKDLFALVADLGKRDNVKKIFLVDAAHPARKVEQGGTPPYHDNLAIVEVRPSTQVTSNGAKVSFTVTIANFSPRDADVKVVPFNDQDGQEISEKNYETPMPVNVPAGKTAQAVFHFPVRAELAEEGDRQLGEDKIVRKGFVRVGVRLQNAAGLALDNDGLGEDNVRHTVIEVRDKVPVLIIDGRNEDGRRPGGDSFYLKTALRSAPEAKYDIHFGDEVMLGGDGRRALAELPDLANYASIMLVNVSRLEVKQREGLELFVKDGGGVCFFMGPDVQPHYYNDELFNKGLGVFPIPLADTYHPSATEKMPPVEFTNRYQVLLRDDQFSRTEQLPIFGPIFRQPSLRGFLKLLPVQRYWPARPAAEWSDEAGQVREVASLPNEGPATALAGAVNQFVKHLPIDSKEYAEYKNGLNRHGTILNGAVGPGSKVPGYKLAELIEQMLLDRGKENERLEFPNLVEFWDLRDVQDLKKEAEQLRRRLLYASPLVVVKDFGRGRVVAWMTTAGKEWNPWPVASPIYPAMMLELQNYLTSQSGDAGQLVGQPFGLTVEAKRFRQDKTLRIVRESFKPVLDKSEIEVAATEHPWTGKDDTVLTFQFNGVAEPGFYELRLLYGDASAKDMPLARWGQTVNVDTRAESNLERVAQEDLDSAFMRQLRDRVEWRALGDMEFVQRADLSELPYYFLFFIGILIAEQALAVHLSSHLRSSEAELPGQVTNPKAQTV